MRVLPKSAAIFLLLLTGSSLQANSALSELYQSPQAGDATYFFESPQGKCTISPTLPAWGNAVTFHVALSQIQYAANDNSAACGVCLKGTYTGQGSGFNPPPKSFTALVVDECPACKSGDLDLAQNGFDGRWDIEWQAIDCPVGDFKLAYVFQGSNPYYLKLGVRNHRIGIQSVQIKSQADAPFIKADRTTDNFFTCSSCPEPLEFPMPIKVVGINGEILEDNVPSLINDVLMPGHKQVQFDQYNHNNSDTTENKLKDCRYVGYYPIDDAQTFQWPPSKFLSNQCQEP